MARTRDFSKVIAKKIASDPALLAEVAKERLNGAIAAAIYSARKDAGLTQKQLADKVGTKQSVIARLEDADYDGHSLTMIWRIADALELRVQLTLESHTDQSEIVGKKFIAAEWTERRAWNPIYDSPMGVSNGVAH